MTLTPIQREMLHSLPRELLLIISSYLDHRSYLSLTQVGKQVQHKLTSSSALLAYLNISDFQATSECLMNLLRHLSSHIYLCEQRITRDHGFVGSIESTFDRTCITKHCHLRFPFEQEPVYLTIKHSTQIYPKYKIHSDLLKTDIYLDSCGEIVIGDKHYQVHAAELILAADAGVYYRGQDKHYYLLSYSGVSKIFKDIPDPVHIKQLCYTKTYHRGEYHLAIEYILYENGDLYETHMGYFDHNNYEWVPFSCKHVMRTIKKIEWLGGRSYYGIGMKDNLFRIKDHKANYLCRLGKVHDMVSCGYDLYFIVDQKKIFSLGEDNRREELIYESDISVDRIALIGSSQLIRLHRVD